MKDVYRCGANRLPRFMVCLALVCLACGSAPTALGQQPGRAARQTEVRVYFSQGDEGGTDANPFHQEPVMRRVSSAAPLRGAMQALIAGPTPEEQARGFFPPFTDGLYLVELKLSRGTALIHYAHRDGTGWPGDSAPARFVDATVRTLKQFRSVRRFYICEEGWLLYDSAVGNMFYEDEERQSRNRKCHQRRR